MREFWYWEMLKQGILFPVKYRERVGPLTTMPLRALLDKELLLP
jgi:hypothetical protein